MNFRAAFRTFLILAAGPTGCSSMGGGTPNGQVQVVVAGVLEPQIESKAEEVFVRHGFEFKGATPGRMEFERDGGVMNNLLYGNWQEDDTSTAVTLFITRRDTMTFALRTRAMAVRHSFGGDGDTKSFDIQGGKYKAILDKIAKELRAENPQ